MAGVPVISHDSHLHSMVKVLMVEFSIRDGEEDSFEQELLRALKRYERRMPDGLLGSLELRPDEEGGKFMHIVFWENKDKWKRFMDSGQTANLSQFVSSKPKMVWFEAMARLQDGKLHVGS